MRHLGESCGHGGRSPGAAIAAGATATTIGVEIDRASFDPRQACALYPYVHACT